ncbi:hypothetical protein N7452_008879 [Penicillium brevicompactum]|uniref:C2H2-type domain-containing protein n=1 Tax=Penicillium brevicompactum TaxID=5074 RepID=A0A9W9UAN8_PENBR|nr:hypothetical protein N7452_008879 [Penicillium brevicompactum]
MSTNEKIRCTYQPCGQYFESIDAMRSHKSSADNHHYCAKCDMDFMNHALLHLHKIMSQRHFACLECELELRSPGGLRHHVKMSHPHGREVCCIGCGIKYKSAAAVMKHIEENECPILDLPARVAREDGLIAGEGFIQSGVASLAEILAEDVSEDESDGGVPLNMGKDNTSLASAQGVKPSSTEKADLGVAGPSRARSNSTSTQSTGGVPLNPTGPLLTEGIPMPLQFEESSQPTHLVQRSSSAEDLKRFFRAELAQYLPRAHGTNTTIDPEDFWDEEHGQYICSCNATFSHLSTFTQHLTEKDDAILECPRCGKRFKTHAALVAHVEAPFSKCAVRVSPAQVEDELGAITRGFAELKGPDRLAIDDFEDIMASSQPSHPGSVESSCGDTPEVEPGSTQEGSAEENAPDKSFIKEDALYHVPEGPTESLCDEMKVKMLREAVIAKIEADTAKWQESRSMAPGLAGDE